MNFASGSNLPKCPAADCDATPNFCDLQKILAVEIALQFVIALCHKSCWFYNLLYTGTVLAQPEPHSISWPNIEYMYIAHTVHMERIYKRSSFIAFKLRKTSCHVMSTEYMDIVHCR